MKKQILLIFVIIFTGGAVLLLTSSLTKKPVKYLPKAEEAIDRCSMDIDVIEETPTNIPTLQPTSTLAPVATAVPTAAPLPISMHCDSITIKKGEQELTDKSSITAGETITISGTFVNKGRLSYAKVDSPDKRVFQGTDIQRVPSGGGGQDAINNVPVTLNTAGWYVFELDTFESSDCNYLCSAGAGYYQNGATGCNSTSWTPLPNNSGQCQGNCLKWIEVLPALNLPLKSQQEGSIEKSTEEAR